MAGESILIVDDNLINLQLMKDLLLLEGYEIRTATNSNEAFETLNTFSPHLILMDIRLPEMDGLTITKILKANDKYKDTIILAVTALATKQDKEDALKAGCSGYIPKPIDVDELPKIVAQFLNSK